MSHLTEQDRCRIENLLNAGLSPLAIARREKRAHSTIVRELRKHCKENEADRRQKRSFCTRKKSCFRKDICQHPPGNCPGRCSLCKIIECRQYCASYEEDVCPKLELSPFVCNGCCDLARCQKRKFFYQAHAAEEEYRELLQNAVRGSTFRKPKSGNTTSCFVTAAVTGKVFTTSWKPTRTCFRSVR